MENVPPVPNLDDDAFHIDQYRTYAALRDKGPVHRVRFGGQDAWLIVRYQEARAALADLRLSNDQKKVYGEVDLPTYLGYSEETKPYFANNMGANDPPDHTRLRKIVAHAFTARQIDRVRVRTEQIASELLDTMRPGQQVDLVERFAHPLPITIICELFGVPSNYHQDFARWSEQILIIDEKHAAERGRAADNLVRTILDLIEQRRAAPGDDLMSALIRIHDSEAGRLNDDELASMTLIMLIAGFETSVSLIASTVQLLLDNPDQMELLRSQPDLVSRAIDETLRIAGPAEVTTRVALEDIQIGDTLIPARSTVLIAGAAANRDPQKFPNPDTFDITRNTQGHLAFGYGVHHCIGRPLAQMEGEVAITALLRRFPHLHLTTPSQNLTWRRSFLRGLTALPVTLN
ncbi:cytochrome P450 [Streptomyces noursei]|uniref:cytochrome P450 family protein n=1 Tax=Streptomyces noursei TaxID=1971 RepID=UPI00081CB448|nr:6-deoxyerythronolide B (6-DEB) oxygenase [Streptomyces noursei ATCC 11455]MCZ0992657.1 cytochrome P450 [Streptomyces noursei]